MLVTYRSGVALLASLDTTLFRGFIEVVQRCYGKPARLLSHIVHFFLLSYQNCHTAPHSGVASPECSLKTKAMSELQAKLAKRRSQLTGHGLTPPPAEACDKLDGGDGASLCGSEATVPDGPAESPAVTPTLVNTTLTPEIGKNQLHSSPEIWRDTPSVKLTPDMVEEKLQAASNVKESDKDVGLADTLKQLDEKIRDSIDEGRPSAASLSGKLESIDDFLGGELNEGLEKLALEEKGERLLRTKSSTQTNIAGSVPSLPSSDGGGLFDDDGDGDISRMQDTILSLKAALREKNDLIDSLQSEVLRLKGSDSRRNDDTVLHSLRESESDPFDAHIGVDRRGQERRASFLTRERINSFSSKGGGGRRRASSAAEFRRPFDSPAKMKDMFQLLLEDEASGSTGATWESKGGYSNEKTVDADEVLFGTKGNDRATLKSNYDPSAISLGGLTLNSRTGRKPAPSSSSSSSSLSAVQAAAMQKSLEEGDLLGEQTMFKDVKSPAVGNPETDTGPGLFSTLDQEASSRGDSVAPVGCSTKASEMNYMDFVDRLSEPDSEGLAQVIKRFLLSVLGPQGDGTAPSIFQDQEIDYKFHGTANLERRIVDFYGAMDTHFRSAWQGLSDEQYVGVIDCLERHVLSMIHDLAYQNVLADTEEDDKYLAEKFELLEFLPPDALDIPVDLQNEVVWAVAGNELRKINAFRTPGEKISCIVACAALITRTLGAVKLRAGQSPDAGADEFLPLFIWVVLKAKVPHLYRNVEYIGAFHHPTRLLGMDGYCLMNLRSSLEFIKDLNSESVTMDAGDFDRQYEAAKRALVAPPPQLE